MTSSNSPSSRRFICFYREGTKRECKFCRTAAANYTEIGTDRQSAAHNAVTCGNFRSDIYAVCHGTVRKIRYLRIVKDKAVFFTVAIGRKRVTHTNFHISPFWQPSKKYRLLQNSN